MKLLFGLLLPLIGTTIGASAVFLMKNKMNKKTEEMFLGIAAGVMIAASFWSLLTPSIDMSENMKIKVLAPTIGFILGVFFLIGIEKLVPYINNKKTSKNKKIIKLSNLKKMILALIIHNIPEGMAVGVAFAGALNLHSPVTFASAYILTLGIAIQNIPEGSIISMPLKQKGHKKTKAFSYGFLSGIIEPISAAITILLTKQITILLPYFLAFAAGAMIYVTIKELVPESQKSKNSNIGIIGFTIGFLIMMILDVTLG